MKTILLNPGPVNTSPRVQQALLRGDLCHREKECSSLLEDISRKLLQAFTPLGGYQVALLSGSGTAAVESTVSSCLTPGKKMLIINNGVYGDRICKMAKAYNLPFIEFQSSWLTPPDLKGIEQALAQDASIEVVAMVHHETSTGLLNPVKEIGQLTHQYGRLLLIDSVSGLGGESIDLSGSHITFCPGSANKCIQGFPGLSFVLIQQDQIERLGTLPKRSLYLSLSTYLQIGDAAIPFTPAIQIAYALSEALDELLEEGVKKREARYHLASQILREGFTRLQFKFLLNESLRSNTITSLYLPPNTSYPGLHHALREKGFVIYAGQGKLQTEIFRVANMGHLVQEDFESFLLTLESILKRML